MWNCQYVISILDILDQYYIKIECSRTPPDGADPAPLCLALATDLEQLARRTLGIEANHHVEIRTLIGTTDRRRFIDPRDRDDIGNGRDRIS